MTTATNTVEGQIVLGGDLRGNGAEPELRPTGVTPGTYTFSQIVVDSKGRLVFAREIPDGELSASVPLATTSLLGKVMVGETLNRDSLSGALTTRIASAANLGTIRTDGVTSTVDGTGLLSLVIQTATASRYGTVKAGSGFLMDGEFLQLESAVDATTSNKGRVQLSATPNGLSITGGVLSATPASAANIGVIKFHPDDLTSGLWVWQADSPALTQPLISVLDANKFTCGIIRPDLFPVDSPFSVDEDNFLNFEVPPGTYDPATTTDLGAVRVGAGLSITDTGLLSLSYLVPATTSSVGTVRVDGVTFSSASGVISANFATTSSLGVLKFTSDFELDGGFLNLTLANGSTFGAVRAGTSGDFTIVDGEIALGVNAARLNEANTFDGAQVTALVTPSTSSTWAPNLSLSNVQQFSLSSLNTTINEPTNGVDGGCYQLILTKTSAANSFTLPSSFILNEPLNTTFGTSERLRLSLIRLSSSEYLVTQNIAPV